MTKHRKTILACLLALLMLLPFGVPFAVPEVKAAADVWDGTWDGSGFSNNHITSAKGFAKFINNAGTGTSYSGQTVYLDVDIDLNSIDFGNISGGKNVYYSRDNYFQGTFDGQGHTIYNFQMHNSDHRVAIFRSARGATFKNFTVDGVFVDDNNNERKNGFAVVVGFGEGNLTFENVHVKNGIVYGYNYVGGLVGEYGANDTLRFTNCSNELTIHADNDRAAGLVGHSKGRVYATNCSNSGEIYAGYSDAGGIAGWIEDDESSFVNCSNTGKVSTDACAGGIFGYFGSKSNDNKMTLTGCTNTGYIESRAKCAGGIAGMMDTDAEHSIENNVNRGDVYGRDDAGGIVGSNIGAGIWRNNKNYGNVRCDNDNAGGILGEIEDDVNKFYNCYNTGSVTGKNSVGGIFGYGNAAAHEFYHCGNGGVVTSTNDCAGGIYGYGGNSQPTIEECWNLGTIRAYNDAGGILGHTNHHSYIRRCFNVGSIETYNHNNSGAHGGIVGHTSDLSGSSNSNPNMTDCFNWGPVSGGWDDGGLIGKIKNGNTPYYITNSYNAGTVTGGRPFAIIAYGGNVGNNVYYKNNVSMGTTQGTGISENDLINSSGFSGNYCKNTWGVKIGSTTYYYPILNWYRDMFHFTLWFRDNPTGTNVYMDNNYGTGWGAPDVSRTGFTPSDWLREDDHSQTIARGSTVWLGVSSPTDQYTVTQDTSDLTHIYNETNHIIEWTRNKYYLDMNAVLDGQYYWDNINFFTADVYVNGEQRADDVVDFYQEIYYEDTYELRDIKPAAGVTFVGMYEGSISGTMGDAAITISPEFKTQFTVTFKDVLGNTLKTETVLFGDGATAPTAPEYLQKANDAENHYHFLGTWDTAFTNVTSDLTVTANYETAAHAYGAQASDGDNTHSRVCANCGYTETNDHNWTWVTDTYADCGNPGVKHEVCSVCGATRSLNTVIDPTGEHTFTAETVTDAALVSGADCEHAAVYYYSCAVCGAVEGNDAHTFTDGDPLDHAWGEPTYVWTDDGHSVTATRVCARDGEHVETETRTLGDGITGAEKTPANCSVMGWTTYTATFTNPAFTAKTKDVQDVPTNNVHDYGAPTYVWADDGHTCTATRVCTRNDAHVDSETVTLGEGITAAVKTQPNCSDKGWTTYTATFTNPAFEDQTKDVQDIPTNDTHAWNAPTYVWSEDGQTCTATRTCANGNHPETETLTLGEGIEAAVKTPANCSVKGWTTYTATFTNDAFETQTKDVQDIETNNDHAWGEASYVWADDGHTVTATRVCTRNDAHVETETRTLGEGIEAAVKNPANCSVKGWTTYTAVFTNPAFETQTKDVQDIETNDDHDYGEPAYVWADDGHTCTATRVCTRNGAHVDAETVTLDNGIAAAVKTPANCSVMGTTTYTAVFTNPAFAQQTKDVQDISTNDDHDWGDPTYVWADDNSTVTATRLCKRDGCTGSETETVATDYGVVTAAQCGVAGLGRYTTRPFTNSAFTQQKKDVEITALTHDWNTPTYVWADDNSTVTATRTCNNGDHPETETVGTGYAVVTAAQCGVAGLGRYTTEDFTNSAFTQQTKDVEIAALEHSWGEPTYVWSVDGKTCTATRICANGDHPETETATVENGQITGTETTPANCTVMGVTTYTATFTNPAFVQQTKDVRDIPTNDDHDWQWHVDLAPTCYSTGLKHEECARCGAVRNEGTEIPKDPEHTWDGGVTVKQPTCLEDGKTLFTCIYCGTTKTEIIPALGHDEQTLMAVEPTCEFRGITGGTTCRRCGAILVQQIVISPLGHDYGPWTQVSAPTCTEAGKEQRVCRRETCGQTRTFGDQTITENPVDEREIPALGHTWGDWTVTTEPTCTAEGTKTAVCSVCSDTKTRAIPATGHKWVPGDGTTATCTEAGTAVWVCENGCGETKTEDVAALGHAWGAWETVTPATAEANGLDRRACTRCGETEERETTYNKPKDRNVQFVAAPGTSITVHAGPTDVVVHDQSAKAIAWYSNEALRFEVKKTAGWSAAGFIVLVNRTELAPNADGTYTLPAGRDYAIVSVELIIDNTPATPSDPGQGSSGSGACKLCGENHGSSFWGRIVAFFHAIIYFFKHLFGG